MTRVVPPAEATLRLLDQALAGRLRSMGDAALRAFAKKQAHRAVVAAAASHPAFDRAFAAEPGAVLPELLEELHRVEEQFDDDAFSAQESRPELYDAAFRAARAAGAVLCHLDPDPLVAAASAAYEAHAAGVEDAT